MMDGVGPWTEGGRGDVDGSNDAEKVSSSCGGSSYPQITSANRISGRRNFRRQFADEKLARRKLSAKSCERLEKKFDGRRTEYCG